MSCNDVHFRIEIGDAKRPKNGRAGLLSLTYSSAEMAAAACADAFGWPGVCLSAWHEDPFEPYAYLYPSESARLAGVRSDTPRIELVRETLIARWTRPDGLPMAAYARDLQGLANVLHAQGYEGDALYIKDRAGNPIGAVTSRDWKYAL